MRSITPLSQALAARPGRGRGAAAAGLALAVLMLHGLLLFAVAPGPLPALGDVTPQHGIAIRVLAGTQSPSAVAAAAAAAGPAQGQPAAAPARATPPARGMGRPPAAAGDVPSPAVQRPIADAPTVSDAVSDAASDAAFDAAPAAARAAARAAAPSAAPSTADEPVPVYATRLPDPAHLQFHLKRGGLQGIAQLVWQRPGNGYVLSLQGELEGKAVLGSVSRGAIDADGVAPLRLTDQRRSRELRAANFQREAQRISFSGPQVEYPLHAGAQDRLSWMIQLPAILEADPSLAQPGTRVTLFVVGTRGDAEAWSFEVQPHQALQLPAGELKRALHLRREPRRPYDTRVEVWLDPQRQHLPVRLVLTSVPYGQPLEFNLSGFAQPGG